MKTIFSKITVLLFISLSTILHSQNKDEKQKQLETLLESKEFVFIADRANPQGQRSVTLSSSNNYLKIHPKTIEANLPYYGRSYSGMPYGGEYGIQFNAEPSDYKLSKTKKNHEITATVKGEHDNYRLNLNIAPDGSATLNISSNKKSSISYYGNIYPADKNTEKD